MILPSLPSVACFGLLSHAAIATKVVQTATQIFNFSTYVDIENSHLRPNGNLLLSTFSNASLFDLDPSVASPQAELVAELPGATAISGIATIANDKFAIIGGVRGNYSYTNISIYTVDFSGNTTNAAVGISASVPEAVLLNGLDSLPAYPNVVLAADSRVGAIFRIDTDTGIVEKIIDDVALNATVDAAVPIGANGLKVLGGYVYYSNTAKNTFGRFPINETGYQTGGVEIVATLNATGYDWDDFVFDSNGNAYIATPNNEFDAISTEGSVSVLLGGGNSTLLKGPTSMTFSLDETKAYISTRGGAVGNYTYSGSVVELQFT